jgi:hypothetical protein
MIDTFRAQLGAAWTADFDAAWLEVAARVRAIIAARAQPA